MRPLPVVYTPAHHGHAPTTEIGWGQPMPTFERPIRAENIREALAGDAGRSFTFVDPVEHGVAPIEAVHDPDLVAFLARAWADYQTEIGPLAEVVPDTMLHPALRAGMGDATRPSGIGAQLGYWCWETFTALTAGTYGAARSAVDVGLTATGLVLDGTSRLAYGLCRPPGHHAPRAAYGGFCFFNNAAIAAHHVATTTGTKVTVLDVDYHHGNGTQQIFYERDDVQYVSLHGDPNRAYPYFVGFADEVGSGRGRGANLNIPMPPRADDEQYLRDLDRAAAAVDAFDPALIFVSLGVDTFERDPISDLAITQEGFEAQGRRVGALGRPTVVLQEGGYSIDAIGENVRRFLVGLLHGAAPGGSPAHA